MLASLVALRDAVAPHAGRLSGLGEGDLADIGRRVAALHGQDLARAIASRRQLVFETGAGPAEDASSTAMAAGMLGGLSSELAEAAMVSGVTGSWAEGDSDPETTAARVMTSPDRTGGVPLLLGVRRVDFCTAGAATQPHSPENSAAGLGGGGEGPAGHRAAAGSEELCRHYRNAKGGLWRAAAAAEAEAEAARAGTNGTAAAAAVLSRLVLERGGGAPTSGDAELARGVAAACRLDALARADGLLGGAAAPGEVASQSCLEVLLGSGGEDQGRDGSGPEGDVMSALVVAATAADAAAALKGPERHAESSAALGCSAAAWVLGRALDAAAELGPRRRKPTSSQLGRHGHAGRVAAASVDAESGDAVMSLPASAEDAPTEAGPGGAAEWLVLGQPLSSIAGAEALPWMRRLLPEQQSAAGQRLVLRVLQGDTPGAPEEDWSAQRLAELPADEGTVATADGYTTQSAAEEGGRPVVRDPRAAVMLARDRPEWAARLVDAFGRPTAIFEGEALALARRRGVAVPHRDSHSRLLASPTGPVPVLRTARRGPVLWASVGGRAHLAHVLRALASNATRADWQRGGSNVRVEAWRCDAEGPDVGVKLGLLVNERERAWAVPACEGSWLCEAGTLVQALAAASPPGVCGPAEWDRRCGGGPSCVA